MARKRKKLGEILCEWNVTTPDKVEQAVGIAKGTGKRIGEALIETNACSESDVARALAAQFDMEYIDLGDSSVQVDQSLIPKDIIKKHLILPMSKSGGRLKVIIHDPMDLELLDLLRFRLNAEIDTVVSAKSAIKSFIDGGVEAQESFVSGDDSLVTTFQTNPAGSASGLELAIT